MTDLKGKGKESDPSSSTNTVPVPPTTTTSTKHAATVAEDDDDDLDELDDVLDQFNAAPPTQAPASKQDPHDRSDKGATTSNGANNDNGEADADDDDDEDEDFEAIFAAELAKEMEKMMGSMQQPLTSGTGTNKAGLAGNTTSTGTNGNGLSLPELDDDEKALLEDKDLAKAFERIMASATAGGGSAGLGGDDDFSMEELSKLMNGLGAGGAGGLPDFGALASSSSATPKTATTSKSSTNGTTGSKAPSSKPKNFEDALQATMSRLADSEAQHKSHTAKGKQGSDDPLAALMAQMESMGGLPGMPGGNGGGGDDENLPEVLDSLMDQLMSKELLHEPITELKHKYPEYLKSAEAASITSEERQRYEKQEVIVNQIYTIFEDPKYDTASQATREKVADLMQQMQECGAPPKPLMGELGPAMALGADGMPSIDPDNCIIS